MNVPYLVPLNIVADPSVNLGVQAPKAVDLGMNVGVYAQVGEHYQGAYEVTPSNAEQVLVTHGLIADGDIIINPIPSNYGLITWDGSVITVS